jgi:predicted DNA-binding transcriptional regulator AlpA
MATVQRLLTAQELAEELGIRVQAIYKSRHQGLGPSAVRIGRRIMFRPEDVTSWLESRHEDQLQDEAS